MATNINYLNDPTDGTHLEKLLKELKGLSKTVKQVIKILYSKRYKSVAIDSYINYVVSLSKDSNSLPMWNYYTQGNGYCIGIDMSDYQKPSDKYFYYDLKEVIYSHDEQRNKIYEIIYEHQDDISLFENGISSNDNDNDEEMGYEISKKLAKQIFMDKIFSYSTVFKNEAYSTENEVRLVVKLIKDEMIVDSFGEEEKIVKPKYRNRNGLFLEYLPIDLDITNIKSITLHPLLSELHLEGLKRYIKTNSL